ncbi:MAG: InlB B-repeat-containing protein, partial [Clostridiales bacterium]|nr:InlB B-repeat-containing protein [Clostridiales bacterium]
GMEVEISMDVKTDDDKIIMTGDINNVWPNYLTTTSNKGAYKTIHAVVKLPNDISSLKVYVETDGKSDLYVDNVTIKRVPLGNQVKFTFDANGQGTAPTALLINEGSYAYQVAPETVTGYDFGGWYKEADCTTPWDFAADVVTEPVTVYAKWTKNADPTPTPLPSNPTPSNTSTPVATPIGNNSVPGIYETTNAYRTVFGSDVKAFNVINTNLKKILVSGKKASYEFNDKDGNLAYSFTFNADNYDAKQALRNMKLDLTMGNAKDLSFNDGMLLSMSQTGKLAMETTLKVNVKDYFKSGDVVYVYKYNKDSKKLECIPNNKLTVNEKSYVSFAIKSGADYVILKAPAKKNEKLGFLAQVKYDKKITIDARRTMNHVFELPDMFEVVSSLNEFDADKNLATIGVTATYKSSNSKIVSIDEEGNIWALRKGKAKVAVTIKTSTGKTKKYVATVVVK